MNSNTETESPILECEKRWVFFILMAVGGYLGAFTLKMRGGVFCNAQTANMVLLAIAIGSGMWSKALYYLIPMSAYLGGTIISELLPSPLKRFHFLRWDTILVGIEAVVIIILGFIPDSWPYQITHITVNFICSMQYNTFRQAEHIPMATTFCTNHIRQTGIYLTKWLKHREETAHKRRFLSHIYMLLSFVAGATASTVLCNLIGSKAVWGAAVLLLILFADLCRADLTKEKDLMDLKPSGH